MQYTSVDFRCTKCNKKLAEGVAVQLSIKCPRCGLINRFERHERLLAQGDHYDDSTPPFFNKP